MNAQTRVQHGQIAGGHACCHLLYVLYVLYLRATAWYANSSTIAPITAPMKPAD